MNTAKNRLYGLDTLRASAIILVFMCHYYDFVSFKPTFGFLSSIGWTGVDLFFILSGYLIGNQIFSAIANRHNFSLKIFYYRRLLRTLPNYFFVLALYFLIPSFREAPLTTSLWKFLTFTQNFSLHTGVAFSHAWSLCIEEQFYLILPAVALLIAFKGSKRSGWFVVLAVLLVGLILRSFFWLNFHIHNAGGNFGAYYHPKIYYSSFCRLDELVLGVSIAMLKNFHPTIWTKLIARGNLFLALGILGTTLTFYLFLHYHFSFFMTSFGFPMLALSFACLTLAALSPNSWFYRIRIPGTATIAAWSYAIYLTHKALIVITSKILFSKWGINPTSFVTVFVSIFVALLGGWLLYTCVETPFLRLRDKLWSKENTPALTPQSAPFGLNQKVQL